MARSSSKAEWFSEGLCFECTQCGNCCTGTTGAVWIEDRDVDLMAGALHLDAKTFRRRFTRKIDGRLSLREVKNGRDYDCVFLDRDENGKALCKIYKARPTQCRTWPFWPENLKSLRSYINVARTCPGTLKGLDGKGRHYSAAEIRKRRDQTPKP